MMMTVQMKALTVAQPQPSASSSPNRARFRGTVIPAVSARWAIVLPALLDRERAGHVRVDGAREGVAAGGQGGHREAPLLDAREDVGLEDLRARGVVDLDVVGGARDLVVELEGE